MHKNTLLATKWFAIQEPIADVAICIRPAQNGEKRKKKRTWLLLGGLKFLIYIWKKTGKGRDIWESPAWT